MLAVAVLALAGCASAPPAVSPQVQKYYEENKTVSTAAPKPQSVFIGDSYTNSAGASSTIAGWPMIAADDLGWFLNVAADSSSGYITKGQKGFTASDLIDQANVPGAKYVVIADGYNDFVGAGYDGAVGDTLDKAKAKWPEAKIVVIGPWSPSARAAEAKAKTRDIIAGEAKERGIPFIDPIAANWTDNPAMIGSDGLHPTDAGHEAIGKKAAQAIKAALG